MDGHQPTHEDDLQLAAEALAGVRSARKQFAVRMRCVPRMLTVMCSRLDHSLGQQDLEDLVQDTLVTIWRRLDSFQGMASLETWAYRFCRFQLANRLRSRGRRPRHVSFEHDDRPADPVESLLEYDDVHRALLCVEDRDRTIITLKHFAQLSFEEIGEHLAISSNTAKSRYYRGLEKLRRMLEPSRRPSQRSSQREVGL